MNATLRPFGAVRPDDLPDWISPFLVKSIRQGMRSHIFAGIFLWAQGSTGLLVLVQALNGDARIRGSDAGFLYWANLFVLFTVLVPLYPVFLQDEDARPGNMDLIRLGSVTPGRVATGKIEALLFNAALLWTAVLPYELVRYFIGGVEIGRDFETIGWITANMVLLAPWGVFIGTTSVGVRIVFSVVMLFAILFVLAGFAMILLSPTHRSGDSPWLPWIALSPIIGMVGWNLAAARFDQW